MIRVVMRDWIDLVERTLYEADRENETAVEALRRDLEARYPGLDLWVSIGPSGDLRLNQIVVPKDQRQQGIGTAVMKALTDFADEHKLPMTLTPDRSYGGSVTRLRQFYRRFGFRPNKGRNKDFRFSGAMLRRSN
jgi:GNAT superfamily N-acetyltransferase